MRLFVAFTLPASVRAELRRRSARLIPLCQKLSRTREEHLHCTVEFLGEVDPARLPELVEALEGVIEGRRGALGRGPASGRRLAAGPPGRGPTVGARLASCGFFRQPDGILLWQGLEPSAAALALQHDVRHALQASGFRTERRPWLAHVTLARRVKVGGGGGGGFGAGASSDVEAGARAGGSEAPGRGPQELLYALRGRPASFRFPSLALFESEFLPEGLRYTARWERRLD